MDKIKEIQKKLQEKELDAVLITDEKNQRYATGFAFTDGAVIVTREHAYLITDSRYVEAAEQAVSERTQVILFGQEHRLVQCIQEILQNEKIEKLGAEEEKLSYQEYLRYEKVLGLPLIPAQEIFQELRASKSEDELEYMRAAQKISERALEDVLGIIRPGITEREIAAELNYRMMKYGAEGNSFDTISITGKKTSMPHGVPGDEVVQDGDFVTMDFGCLKGGYCSDMTRTVAVGHVTDEMKKIYGIVLEAQLRGIENARAGITGAEIDKAAREVIANAGYGAYFGHSFGHSLGLDIHEAPYAMPRSQTIMPEGAVVSADLSSRTFWSPDRRRDDPAQGSCRCDHRGTKTADHFVMEGTYAEESEKHVSGRRKPMAFHRPADHCGHCDRKFLHSESTGCGLCHPVRTWHMPSHCLHDSISRSKKK